MKFLSSVVVSALTVVSVWGRGANNTVSGRNATSYDDHVLDSRKLIIGGTPVPNSAPYKFAVYITSSNSKQGWCGGSLIHPRWVLTAAHCISGSLKFQVGVYDIKNNKNNIYAPDTQIVYPNWSSGKNDVALVRLTKAVSGAQTIRLSSKSGQPQEAEGAMQTVIGWGYTKFGSGKTSTVLNEVDVPICTHKQCSTAYAGMADKKSTFCAGYYGKGGSDSCSGDSGGPIFNTDKNGNILQVGTVSYGKGCADPDYPGLYMRVSYFYSWIVDNLDKYGDQLPSGAPTSQPSPSSPPSPSANTPTPTAEPSYPKYDGNFISLGIPQTICKGNVLSTKGGVTNAHDCYTSCVGRSGCASFALGTDKKCQLYSAGCSQASNKKYAYYILDHVEAYARSGKGKYTTYTKQRCPNSSSQYSLSNEIYQNYSSSQCAEKCNDHSYCGAYVINDVGNCVLYHTCLLEATSKNINSYVRNY